MQYRIAPTIERPRTICIAGGTGFVGQELISRLTRAGHELRVLTRASSHAIDLMPLPSVELAVGDVYSPEFLRRSIDGCDVVINLVGILNERGFGGAGFRRAHVQFTSALLHAMQQLHIPRLLQMSALNADAEHGRSHYLRSKGAAEDLIRVAGPALDWTIFRPSVIFGPGDSLTNRFARLLRQTAGILPLARARARFAPIYVGDVAAAFMQALHGGPSSRKYYELCGPEVLTLEQIVRITARAACLPCHIYRLPDPLARLQASVMQFLPGKPFSVDNYRSLLTDSVCHYDDCRQLGLARANLSALAPLWLAPKPLALPRPAL
ncbi:MAG TPA: complex I NDUFA9 subunit family protein [Steroidobacteraceae bacterium]|jgi:NADH dehydrogenase|nr:complex I NDUFA9 subunit family protein [Steroidobacteraceae bacterium]